MCGCAHFLSLIDGPDVKGLIERSYDWLHNVESGKSPLPFDRMAWGVLEADFKRAFVDYTKQERAQRNEKVEDDRRARQRVYRLVRKLGASCRRRPQRPFELRTFAKGLP